MVDPFMTIIAMAIILGAAQGLVTLRWYEPDVPGDGPRLPLLEAGLFVVIFGLTFVLIGWVVWTIGALWEPHTRLATLVITPVGYLLAGLAFLDRLPTERETATRYFGVVFFTGIGSFPLVFVAIA